MAKEKTLENAQDPFENANRQGEKFIEELDSLTGAQKLGDQAYETAKQDLEKKGIKP